MVENGSNRHIIGVLVLLLFSLPLFSQTNLSGKPGMLYVPSALEQKDGDFRFGYNYNPIHYGLRGPKKNPEQILFAHLAILPRLELSLTLLQMLDSPKRNVSEGIGDRNMDIRYLLLKETKKHPSVAIIMSVPFTVDGAMLTHVVVATKQFQLNKALALETTLGLGSPYFVYRNRTTFQNDSFLTGFTWQKKSTWRFPNQYLVGLFGGAILHYQKKAGIIAEYDSQRLNLGAYVTFFRKWTVQAGLLNGDQLMFGTSYATNLFTLPSQLKKK